MAALLQLPESLNPKQKTFEDAKRMQAVVFDECRRAGKEPPPYVLSELIGKGSFGRVYKASSLDTNRLYAVKIIDIEQSDTECPTSSDTYSDLLKEINALKRLGDSGAKNINLVIEAISVGQTMWMITEYCAGGSVATLMKPTFPGGLQEKWIIPILREVAEAVLWVHKEGIIHRDIKCANILVTEAGAVQLCDFGVAGIIENKVDKRSTFIGTLQWMAPELFHMDSAISYGTEVDIWAFGSMAYEIASGYPPNVSAGNDFNKLWNALQQQPPRLEGDQYSSGLKDFVATCLVSDPKKRPTIEHVQQHDFIRDTSDTYHTSSLALLVRAYRLWEAQGGSRRSLFAGGGALAPPDKSYHALDNDEWNFSTTAAFDQQVFKDNNPEDVYDVYGSHIDFSSQSTPEQILRPDKKGMARRRPLLHLPVVKAPLQKVFDPNTISNYQENARVYYGRPAPPLTSDLPLRDDSVQSVSVRESLIDLDESLHGGRLSQFVDAKTIKPVGRESVIYDMDMDLAIHPTSDPVASDNNRRTQEWKFPPLTAPSASTNPALWRFPIHDEDFVGHTPLLGHQQMKTITSHEYVDVSIQDTAAHRISTSSLIDLDMTVPDPNDSRPSTSYSDFDFSDSGFGSGNSFELGRRPSLYVDHQPSSLHQTHVPLLDVDRQPSLYFETKPSLPNGRLPSLYVESNSPPLTMRSNAREPSIYISDESGLQSRIDLPATGPTSRYLSHTNHNTDIDAQATSNVAVSDYEPGSLRHTEGTVEGLVAPQRARQPRSLPPIPDPPSGTVMLGQASPAEVKDELRRMAMSMGEHLSHVNAALSGMPIRRNSARGELKSDSTALSIMI